MISKLIGILLIVFPCSSIYPQTAFKKFDQKCIYDFTYQPDSTDVNSRASEKMLLLLNNNQSLFLSFNKYMYDSISYQGYLRNGNTLGDMATAMAYQSKISYMIIKGNDEIETFDERGVKHFVYKEKKASIKWELINDTMTINSLPCQKAIATFGNRNWVAWFSTTIPINEGPYKFCGLPGLIISLYDTQNYFHFQLSSFQMVQGIYNTLPTENKIIKTTKKGFFKYALYYHNNTYEADQLNGTTFTGGQEFIKARLNELARKNNNWIEKYN